MPKKKKSKKNKVILWLLMILVVGFAALSYFSQQFAVINTIPSNAIIKPIWGRLSCEESQLTYKNVPVSTFTQSGLFNITGLFNINKKREASITCGVQEYVDSCKVNLNLVNVDNITGFLARGTINLKVYNCEIQNNNCNIVSGVPTIISKSSLQAGTNLPLPDLKEGRRYYVALETTFKDPAGAVLESSFYPYKLYKISGSRTEVRAQNCCIQDTSIFNSVPKEEQLTNCINRRDNYNMIVEWVYGPATNVVDYQGRKVYCNENPASLYELATVTMKDGTLVQIDPSYVEKGNEPSYFNTLGKKIKDVECCSGRNCKDFKLVSGGEDACFTDAQCLNGGGQIPIDAKHYIYEFCNKEKKCEKSKPIVVECTNNNVCSSGQVCDLSRTNYGKCVDQNVPYQCGNNKCEKEESVNSCPTDCKEEEDKSFNFLPFLIIGIAVLFAGIVIVLTQRRK